MPSSAKAKKNLSKKNVLFNFRCIQLQILKGFKSYQGDMYPLLKKLQSFIRLFLFQRNSNTHPKKSNKN